MSLVLLFHYLLFNMFRMLVHPSSGVCDLLWVDFMCCVALVSCVLVLRCGSAGWCGIIMQAEAISRKLLKMDVLTFETCWAVNSEIIKQVTSSWSIFMQLETNFIFYKTNICTSNITNKKCLSLLLRISATLRHLQGVCTLTFKTHYNVIHYNTQCITTLQWVLQTGVQTPWR